MSRVKHRQKILEGLAAVEAVRGILTDGQAAECPALYPEWDGNGKAYKVGDRLIYSSTLYKVKQSHTSQPDWAPDVATSLFTEILPGQDGTEVGEWEEPVGNKGLYNKGDRCRYNGKIYESLIDNNSWSPDGYPAGWKLVG